MQEPLESSVAGRFMCAIHGVVILAEKLGAFLLGQIPEDNLRVIRILYLDGPDRHEIYATPRRGRRSVDALRVRTGGGPYLAAWPASAMLAQR